MNDFRKACSASVTRRPENASHLPSAEKLAALWLQSPSVICRGVPPSAGMTNTCRYESSVKPMRSDRKFSRVTTCGASIHFAPLGGAGIAMRQLSLIGTFIVKAIDLPSGAHSSDDGVSVRCEIWLTEPSASMHFTKICEPVGSPVAI